MTARTVTSTVRSPASGTARAGMPVIVELLAANRLTGGFLGDKRRVNSRHTTTTDANGVWSADLEPNAGTGVTSPAETIYRVIENPTGLGRWVYYILVPDVVGPHEAADIEVDSTGLPTGDTSDVMRYADGTVMRYEDGTAMRYES